MRTRQGVARWAARLLVVVVALTVAATAVGVAALVSGDTPGNGSWTITPVLAAAVTGALLWEPVRRRTRHAAGRLMMGATRDPHDIVRSFGRRASRDMADDELLVQLSEALVRVFRAASAEVWRDVGGQFDLTVSVPHRQMAAWQMNADARRILENGGAVGRAWLEMWQPNLLLHRPIGEIRAVPATHAGALLGLVVIARLPGGERFTADEDASLAELGTRLGVVLHNRELDATLRETLEDLRHTNAELRASRVRLVTTADAERRRIERDLHDGAQQHLVALAVNLRLAADEVVADPRVTRDVFESLGRDVRDAIDELRNLAHGIYPPLLQDAGLIEALTASARRSASHVTITSASIGRYAPEIEAAIYYCCMEALQNAGKHAPDAAVHMHLEQSDGQLRFRVDDDGPGLADGTRPHGHGLSNMTDRMGAIGGELELTASPSGGTSVCGTVPVESNQVVRSAIELDGR
jgi:signal transduction histidine kinase